MAAAGRDVEHVSGVPGGAPGQQPIEILAGRVEGARHVGRRARAELLLDAPGLRVGHFLGVRSARWRKRKSASSGDRSNRRDASSTSFTRSTAGLSRS